ncbi:MAG: hypothetical protein WB609_10260 [Candidatus Cybelea sp.]
MTDEDRYGRKLGKKFEAVRGCLCSPQAQDEAPDVTAAYMIKQFLKEMPDFKDFVADAVRAIESRNSFFEDVEAFERLKRTTNGSLAEAHFIQSMKEVIDERKDAREILRRLAAITVDSYGRVIKNQNGYANDVACHTAFAHHALQIEHCLINRLFAKAGLAPTVVVTIKPQKDTRSILDLQIVSKNE